MEQFEKFFSKFGEGEKIKNIDLNQLEDIHEYFIPEIFNFLENSGVSSFMDKFFWTLDPMEYLEWLNDWVGFKELVIPFARTGFGDILFIKEKQVMILLSNKGLLDYTTKRVDWFFNRYLTDDKYIENYFCIDMFCNVKDAEKLTHEECFGYFPLLSLGGSEKIENLKRVKMKEYLLLVSQSSGSLTFHPH